MFRRLAIGLAVAALIALPASQSSAGDKKDDDGFIGVGANFTWDNYKTPILRYTGTDVPPGLSSLDYGGPNFGGAFHWGITNKLVLTASLDFGFFSHTVYPYPASGAEDIASVTANFWQIGAMLGVKYFFKEPEAGKVSLYLTAGIGKYFAGTSSNAKAKDNQNAIRSAFYDEDDCTTFPESCDGDEKLEDDELDDAWDEWVDGDGEEAWEDAQDDDKTAQKAIDAELEMAGDMASPFVAQIAVGAEFFATDTFSIGADILGLRFAFASADVGKVKGTDQDTGTWTGEQKYVNLYIYSGLTMNFNLTGGEATPKKEEDPVADDGWGTPASGGGSNDGWGSGGGQGGGQGGWGGGGGWSTGPAAPTPAPQPATQPAPQPAAPAPTPGAPAPAPGQPGGDIPPPPPPPPPPPA